jgi:L-lactate utilization protein LutC
VDRTAFLGRIRDTLVGVEAPALPEGFPSTPASAPDATSERFLSALLAVSGTGALVDPSGLSGAIAEAVGALSSDRDGRTAVVAPDADPYADAIDAALASAGMDAVRPEGGSAWREAAAMATAGITSARLGIAATGSVLIVSGADSPRAASILPEHHLVLLPVERLVASLEDAMPVIAEAAAHSSGPFLVTGPSRTSDIEMEMVLGAHGPRTLHVLLIG